MTTCRFHVPRRQRGVIGLLGAMVMTLVVVCTALALDTGRLYMEKRNLQRVADLAALSVASRCEYLSACEKAVEYAQDVLADNGYSRELVDSDGITLGRVTLEDVAAEGGTAYRLYGFESASHAQDAVEVVLDRTVSPPLMAALMPDDSSTTLQSTAVARKTNYVAFSVGSRLASLDTSSSPLLAPILGGLLGSDVPLSLVGYEGVLDTQITLLELASQMPALGADLAALTVDEMLDATISLSEVVQASARVLTKKGALESQVELLDEMAERLDTSGIGGDGLELGDILDVQSADGVDDTEALKSEIRLGDLLGTSLLLANKDNAISLEDVNVDLPGVTADVELEVVEAPQVAIGPIGCADGTEPGCGANNWRISAKTGQLDLGLSLDIDLLGLVTLTLDLDTSAASAVSGVEKVVPGGDGEDVKVGAISQPVSLQPSVELTVLEEAGGLISVSLETSSEYPQAVTGGKEGYLTGTIEDWPNKQSITLSSGVEGVTDSLKSSLENLEFDIQLISGAEECSSILCDLLSEVMDPVNELIDVTVESVSDLEEALVSALLEVIDPSDSEQEGVVNLMDGLLGSAGLGLGEIDVEVLEIHSSGAELVQ